MTGPASIDALRDAALAAMARAYAPYSGFRVGAAVETAEGSVFVGCNVENAAYPAGLCAERAALAAAVAHGAHVVRRLVIATDGAEPAPPCGVCRQVLAELASEAEVVSVTSQGQVARWPVAALIPAPFTSASMDRR